MEQNLDKMPSELSRMKEFEGVPKSTLAYRRKMLKKNDRGDDAKELAAHLRQYMNLHGLPAVYLQPISRLLNHLEK